MTLAKQMYPGQTDFFLNQYEEAVKRPFGYLLIDLKTITQDNCRLRTNVLPLLPAMQEIQDNMDDVLSRNDLRDE